MNIVIQCAGKKHGGFFRTKEGREAFFVADPARAPKDDGRVYAHPDDQVGDGLTWREALLRYNVAPDNPMGLARAFELYPAASVSAFRRRQERTGSMNAPTPFSMGR